MYILLIGNPKKGAADIFLDHLPINVLDGSKCYKSKTSSVLKLTYCKTPE